MLAESTTLDITKIEMSKGKKKKTQKRNQGEPPGLSSAQKDYITVLETELAEQRLRILLYQNIFSTASEQIGYDILKKIGGQRSGP